jgi:hypothetical protein
MGKKSSQKKQRPKQQHKPTQAAVRQGMVIPSLSGGVAPMPTAKPTQERALNFGEQTEYVRSDILRIVLLLVGAAIVLAVLALANAKTPYLEEAGRQVASFLRLQ